jgi:hypothetical protein
MESPYNFSMDLTKLLQAIEEFIYEIACLTVLIPKTFFLLSFRPGLVHAYVTQELGKPKDERFDRFASPLLFWLVTGILPNFLVLSIFASLPAIRELVPTDYWISQFLHLSIENRFVALSAFAVSFPLAFAITIARAQKAETSRNSLREPFTQCYCLSPLLFACVPIWYLLEAAARGRHADITYFSSAYYYALGGWLIWVELSLFRAHLQIGWRRSLVLLGKSYWIFFFVLIILDSSILMLVALSNMEAEGQRSQTSLHPGQRLQSRLPALPRQRFLRHSQSNFQ